MTEAIQGDIITSARAARKDVLIREGRRGGIEYATLSYLDVLLDNDIISIAQANLGRCFWTLRDCSFPQLQIQIMNSEYQSPDDEGLEAKEEEISPEEGMATEMYRAIMKRLSKRDRETINASCQSIPTLYLPMQMIIIQAFGENRLRIAFENLEKIYEEAKDEAEQKINMQDNACAYV